MIKSNLDKVRQADHHGTLCYVMPFLYQLRVTVIILSYVRYLQKYAVKITQFKDRNKFQV
jgi:hypothetical protein